MVKNDIIMLSSDFQILKNWVFESAVLKNSSNLANFQSSGKHTGGPSKKFLQFHVRLLGALACQSLTPSVYY